MRVFGGLGKKRGGNEKVQIGSYRIVTRDVNYSTGNRVNNIRITVYGAMWVLEILGGLLCKA